MNGFITVPVAGSHQSLSVTTIGVSPVGERDGIPKKAFSKLISGGSMTSIAGANQVSHVF